MAARVPTPQLSQPSGYQDGKSVNLPKPFKLRRFYTPGEVARHNTANDCWVSFFYGVYDLTKLIHDNLENQAALCKPIYDVAGSDISHWFDPISQEPKRAVNPETNLYWWHCPTGRYLHIPPMIPDSTWDPTSFLLPWWKDVGLRIGQLTEKTRKLRVINMQTKDDDIIEVCSEETLNEILDRYIDLNEHAASYTWKRLGRPLDMDKTLEENDIPDETEEFIDLNIDEHMYIPAVHLYYNDDLTVK